MYNPFTLKGKTILVTGASSGIGRGIAVECSKMGAFVIVTGRNKERLHETYNLLEGDGHAQIIADLSKNENIENLIDQCPPLDGCVNNAGIPKLSTIKFIKHESLKEILDINTIAPIILTSTLVKKKKIKKGASVVFISSISGVIISTLGESTYSASKGAINGFVKGAAIDLASQRIRVNSVNPGLIQTNILELANEIFSEEQIQEKLKQYPLKRIGQPEDVAYAAIYLLSDASSWVTGSNIVIDGGFTLQ
jgi:NAD(P)-dependent dehydrogenase (short-subunit alcohol dehydrogenase family)